MKSVIKHYSFILLVFISICIFGNNIRAQNFNSQEKASISDFEKKAAEYAKLSQNLAKQIPKLSSKSSAEEIEAYKISLQKLVQNARVNAKQGDIFNPSISQIIRKIIKNEFSGNERKELREKVFEPEVTGFMVKVNSPYPDSKEMVDMPPTLLINLPQLPKQLRYRFVGSYFLIMDRENGLIIDYMTNSLP